MTRVSRFLRGPVIVSKVSVLMLAASSLVSVVGLFLALLFAQSQAAQADDRADCRSRIDGYVTALEHDRDNAEALGLLDRVGAEGLPITFDEAVQRATAAVLLLEDARVMREDSVEICAANPDFDPATDNAKDHQ